MTNLLRANIFRLKRTLVVWGGALVSAGLGMMIVHTQISDLRELGVEFTLDEVFFGYAMCIGLFMAVLISTFLGTDYSDGSIRNKLTVGSLRRDVYLSNLLSVIGICFLYCMVYMIAVTAMTAPVRGFFTQDGKLLLTALAGSLLTGVAFCSLYTCIAMNCSHKATSAIICILLFFALLSASTYVLAKLDAPPERMTASIVNGEFTTSMEPNPKYLQDDERAVYQFFYDLLPTGQASQYFTLGFANPLRMMLCSLGTIVVSTLGGLALFERKDLK